MFFRAGRACGGLCSNGTPSNVPAFGISQAAGGYVSYDGEGRYHLEPEQVVALTDQTTRACVIGGFEAFTSASRIAPALHDAFRDGTGWGGRG